MFTMICMIVSLCCVGLVIGFCVKAEKFMGEAKINKQEYLKAKTSYLQINDQYDEMVHTLSDVMKLNRGYKKSLEELNVTVKEQGELIQSLTHDVSVLKEENRLIKKRLGIYDQITPNYVVKESFVTKI